MAEKTVATSPAATPPQTMEGTRTRERYMTPPVDIYEMAEGLVVVADMPGVDSNALDVRVDNHLLTLQGTACHVAPGDVVYREYELMNYFRQFELSDKVDASKIRAEFKHGVLTLHLPKAEVAKPQHIEVRVS
jgi:HSP20 family molecular chaperone IbpA